MPTTTDQAYDAGRRAFDSRWPIEKCPHYGMGEEGYQLRSAWRRGWSEANGERLHEVARR